MSKNSIKINTQEDILYNNILSLSRNKLFFTKFCLADSFQNRIYLIFIHISFLFTYSLKIKNLLDSTDAHSLPAEIIFSLRACAELYKPISK